MKIHFRNCPLTPPPPPLPNSRPLPPFLPLDGRKKEMKFFNYEPITVNKKNMHYSRSHCINHTTPPPQKKETPPPRFNLEVKASSSSLSHTLSLFVPQHALQISLTRRPPPSPPHLVCPSLLPPSWCWWRVYINNYCVGDQWESR